MSIIRDTIENQRTTTPTKVGDAIGVDEAVNQGQITSTTPIPGSNVEQVNGVQGALLGVGGQGYSWVNEKSNRAIGTTYTNTYGKPIGVSLTVSGQNNSDDNATFQIGGVDAFDMAYMNSSAYARNGNFFIIPNGETYVLNNGTANANTSVTAWVELK